MKKRATPLLAVLAACLIGLPATDGAARTKTVRGEGPVTTRTLRVEDVHAVAHRISGDLFIEQGREEKLVVEAQENLHEYLEIRARGGTLVIDTRRRVDLHTTRPLRFHLTVRSLDEIVLDGSGDIEVAGLDVRELELDLRGSGDVTLTDLAAGTLDVTISGSGDVEMDGRVDAQRIRISGSGNYDAARLRSDAASASISGSGSIVIWVRERLEAGISGSGDIRYRGDPRLRRRGVTGSGDIERI
ncbi:MAG: DUF2807 domain-containing protein [Candidatus Krumholzibacteriota bacterium]|nr:DUF2807 domain-containing protein [Candidatus Krumholzibacteriota bacterium]